MTVEFVQLNDTSYEVNFDKMNFSEDMSRVLDTLPDQMRLVLKARFGFLSEEKMTLAQVGALMNLAPERIRQIQDKALRMLKHPSRSRLLRIYLDQ